MSRWSIDFENHPIHETLRQTAEWLDTDVENTEVGFEEERLRLKKVIAKLQNIVAGLDTDFFPQQWLDQINQHLRHQNFFQQLQSYENAPQLSNLQSANNHITSIAPQIYQLAAMSRPLESRKVIRQAEEAFVSFAVSMESTANDTDARFKESEATLAKLEAVASNLEQQLEGLNKTTEEKLSEWQAEFTEKQATRVQEHTEAQIERETKYEELLNEWKSEVETQRSTIAKEQSDRLQATLDHFSESGEAILKDMNAKHASVLEIHKLVGRDSVAGGYQQSAGEEKRQANAWRWISMTSLAAAVIWLIVKYKAGFTPMEDGGLNWTEIVTASSLTAIFLIAAGYTSRQSKMHRDNEKQLRSFALETKALDPFMANLGEDEQKAIKAELIRRMFGQQHQQSSGKTTKLDDGSIKSIAERIADAVGKIADRR